MRSGGHWSAKAARRTLDALMSLGGRGTTRQIRKLTDSEAVHQDVHSLRCWLQFEHGYEEADTLEAVKRTHLRTTDKGKQVQLYTLREDVRRLHRRLRSEPAHVRQGKLFETEDHMTRMRKAGL